MPRSLASAGVLLVLVTSTTGQTPKAEIERLGDPQHGEAAELALVALGVAAVPGLASYLADADATAEDGIARLQAALRVVSLLGPIAAPLAPELRELAKDRDCRVHLEIAWARGSLEPWVKDQNWHQPFHLIMSGDRSDLAPLFTAFSRQARRLGVPAAGDVPALLQNLARNELFVREAVADLLAERGAGEAIDPLRAMLLDRTAKPVDWDALRHNAFVVPWDDAFRWRAGEALLRIAPDDPRSMIGWACRAAHHPHRSVRRAALQRLGSAGPAAAEALPELEQIARGADPELAVEALKVLGMTGPAAVAAYPTVTALQAHADAAVQVRARSLAAQLRAMGANDPTAAELQAQRQAQARAAAIATFASEVEHPERGPAARAALLQAGVDGLAALCERLRRDGKDAPDALLWALAEAARGSPAPIRRDVRQKILASPGAQWAAPMMTSSSGGELRELHYRLYADLEVGRPDAVADLVAFLAHENPWVRLVAAEQLAARPDLAKERDADGIRAALSAAAMGEHPRKAEIEIATHHNTTIDCDLDARIHAAAAAALAKLRP
jgi:hypothetical protein